MSIQQFKTEINNNIDQIIKFDLSKLYVKGPNVGDWNNLSNSEIEEFVKDMTNLLKDLKKNSNLLNTISLKSITQIRNSLISFINSFTSIQTLGVEQITTHHHAPLNELDQLRAIFGSSGLYAELKLTPQLPEKLAQLKKVNPLIKKLLEKHSNIEEAISSSEKWLSSNREANQQAIDGQAEAFHNRAKEHKLGGNTLYWIFSKKKVCIEKSPDSWLVSTFIFSFIVLGITIWLIISAEGIESGEAILRITALLVPSYLTVFSANQYLYHKKMHEAYMFRYSSLKTMNNLISNKTEITMQEKILSKGLDVLFSEPTIKEDSGKYDKQLVGELLGMLRSQLK